MTLIELARKLRPIIEEAMQSLDDGKALEAVTLFPLWEGSASYSVGTRVCFGGKLYRCLQAHTANPTWTPSAAPSLWAEVLIPDSGEPVPWVQPESTNPYSAGDRVTHNGKTWVSTIDGNVWEPGVYGWTEEP